MATRHRSNDQFHRIRWPRVVSVFALVFACGTTSLFAADWSATRQLLFRGQYDKCMKAARTEVERGVRNENWSSILLECQLMTGKYEEAVETLELALSMFPQSIRLRFLGHQVYQYANQPENAATQYEVIVSLVQRSAWRYSSSVDRVVLGRFLAAQGEDARDILELFYDRSKKSNPRYAEAYIAIAELALEKHDYQEAAKTLTAAVELEPDNPEIQYLLAQAWKTDREKVTAFINRALELNPQHVPSLLFQVDNLIDGEKYEESLRQLSAVFRVNADHPEAWAYRAVIAHLQGNSDGEAEYRDRALKHWKTNPHVDHLIGRKLSRNYRFAEGAAYQRRALSFDESFLAARFQLSQDLLRLGNEEEGWRLANQVHDADGYNVVAFNTVTLQKELAKFDTIESEHFLIRMDAREARIYGPQALQLLEEAHDRFIEKYDAQLEYPTIVEIFPSQKDFAIRTFGLPGGAGYLGVCFGRVVTANSPASQGAVPANWQSVLWHEFCHVVTLSKTRNKMPRWLSEGISTYEEQERNSSWGERLNPAYHRMIAGEDLTPVSQLSSAFLSPKSALHLQFAYFESSLVVRYLVEKYGLDTLKRILTDLGVGMPIHESLTRYVGSLDQLDQEFARYAREFARKAAPTIDWSWQEEWETLEPAEFVKTLAANPNNYGLLIRKARAAIEAEQYSVAESTLLDLKTSYPNDRAAEGCLALLARIYSRTDREQEELEILGELAQLNDRALDAYARLADYQISQSEWDAARSNALRYLAVQPLQPKGHELLARVAKAQNQPVDRSRALSALLEMQPVDPALAYYELAEAFASAGDKESAKRRVLQALEQAPRYIAAQKLLLDLVDQARRISSNPNTDGVDE